MKRNVVFLLLVVVLLFALTGCKNKATIKNNNQNGDTSIFFRGSYESLPDESIYDEFGVLIATGKDLVPQDATITD